MTRNRDSMLNIEHISAKLNIEDLLTTGLSPTFYERYALNMGLANSFDKVLVQGH
jgi:hypothetical protein